jgi:predicted nucleotidyltransferase
MKLRHLDQCHESVRTNLETWFSQVLDVFGEQVDSVYIYGSVITSDFRPKQSDINSMILFKSLPFSVMRQLRPLVKEGLKMRIIAPLCLSVRTFTRSADTFPLEFIEIKDKHICVYGERDHVADLVIPQEHLRVKIEEQIKGKLIRLRQIYMEQGDAPKKLLPYACEALGQLFPVFRNMLRFQGVAQPPIDKKSILEKLGDVNQLSVVACLKILAHVQEQETIAAADMEGVYGEFLEVLLSLATTVDQLSSVRESVEGLKEK